MGRMTALAIMWRSTIPSMVTIAVSLPQTVSRRTVKSALTPNWARR